MKKLLLQFIGAVSLVSFIHAASLFPCPDCDAQVSSRALMCPHCGCPGETIAEAVAQSRKDKDAETRSLSPIAKVTASAGRGYAVAVMDGMRKYLVMDTTLLWEADFLTITPLATNSLIAYRALQLANDVPLARFLTDATNLSYLAIAHTSTVLEDQLYWVVASEKDGFCVREPMPAEVTDHCAPGHGSPVALVDDHTNVVGVAFQNEDNRYRFGLPADGKWLNVSPGLLRAQTQLLSMADRERVAELLAPETRKQLLKTDWLTDFLRKKAEAILQKSNEEKEP